jgi:hypothetical protein
MFNSPLAFCPIANCFVPLDEPPPECAARNRCAIERCPLAPFFVPAEKGAGQSAQAVAVDAPPAPQATESAPR